MSWISDWQDLIDLIEREKGWRAIANGSRHWIVYPPDKSLSVIHLTATSDHHALDNVKARLRRAGFMPLLRQQSTRAMQVTKESTPKATPQVAATPKQPASGQPRDLIAEARGHINRAVDSLSLLDGVLTEIGADEAKVAKIRELLQAVMK